MSCVLGFDVGTRLIGVAVGNSITASARPLMTLAVHSGVADWPRIDALLAEWQPHTLVVGLPLTLDGGEQKITATARRFAQRLRQCSGIAVVLSDERYSSQEASRRFAADRAAGLRRRRDAAHIDADAAAIILERWLAQPHAVASP